MILEHEICYRALQTRDARFDGRFFTGVISTGIYCRPVCPARTPKAANCEFFACAAAAELTNLPGIGDWTAQYIALRVLGEPDAFPAADTLRCCYGVDPRPEDVRCRMRSLPNV